MTQRINLTGYIRSNNRSMNLIAPSMRSILGKNKGFTLVELLVVCIIIGILATFAIPVYNKFFENAKRAQAISELHTISMEINAYLYEQNQLPTGLDKIKRAGYLDPWKNPYVYTSTAVLENHFGQKYNSTFDLYSMGRNGVSPVSYDPAIPDGVDDLIVYNDGAYVGLRE